MRLVAATVDEAGRVERLDDSGVGGALGAAALEDEGGDLLALFELSDGGEGGRDRTAFELLLLLGLVVLGVGHVER